jgi:gluconate 2-dehydrogenase gamma chain
MAAGSGRANVTRRHLLLASGAAACFTGLASPTRAVELTGIPAWDPNTGAPPPPPTPGPWQFFTPEEGAAVEALVDRLIPPDPQWAGGKDAGCAVFIDRQLAGAFGTSRGLYMRPPFDENAKYRGPQSPFTPAQRYRSSLAGLDKHCKASFAGKPFVQIPDDQKDKILSELQSGALPLEDASGKGFFELLWQNTREGFFADPVYGGNRDMVGWRMIGFPGARYDYRDWIERYNETYPRPPVAIGGGRPEWTPRQG